MGISHPLSGKSARRLVGQTQSVINHQADAILALTREAKRQREHVEALLEINGRGILGRLRWLLLGK